MSDLRSEKTKLPTLLRIGPAYAMDVAGILSTLTLASDLVHIFPEKQTYVNVGGELAFDQTFAARTGYEFGSQGRGFSAGVGVNYGILSVDYAYAPLSSDLGNTHTISLAIGL
jgi:hypothetical protein